MTKISPEEILKIRSSASIVDIISSYIPLTPKGKNYFGVCPFHEDHSPSLSVSPEKQIYKCFSCGATGNVLTFLENYLNISFMEAVNLLTSKLGIAVSIDLTPKVNLKYQKEYDLMDFALKFYHNNLNTEAGTKAREYLYKRGLTDEVIDDFDLGLSLDKNLLTTILNKKGYDNEMLYNLGLISDVLNPHDMFLNRIMFPIHNLEGQVVAFTARAYQEEIKPKYINSKETYIFKKGNILFNYHRAKDMARTLKEVVIVEGNMDAIRLYASGIKNVMALMGTSLTKDQIEVLKKLRAKIILMLDNDEAGETATYLVGQALEEKNIDFSVVRLSDAKDPDEYVLKFGAEAITKNIKNAISFMDFKLVYLKKDKNLNEAEGLASYLKEVLKSLVNADEILKEVTLQKLSNDYNISYGVLKNELGEQKPQDKELVIEPLPVIKKKKGYEKLAEEILYLMMNSVNYIKMFQVQLGMFPEKEHRVIANEIMYYYEKNKDINLADFITYAETTDLKKEIMAIINKGYMDEVSDEVMLELLMSFKNKIRRQKELEIKKQLKLEMDENKKVALLEELTKLKKGCVEDESN